MGRSSGTLLRTSAEELEVHVGDQEQVPGLKTIVESQGQVAGLEDELQSLAGSCPWRTQSLQLD